jgi:hypothetical protein
MCKKTTNNDVFKKYTLICAINSRGLVGFKLYEFTTNEKFFEKIYK